MRRALAALALLLSPAVASAQGIGTPAFRGQVLFPLTFSPDNTHDIGASGATRPRNVYVATSVITPALTVSGLTSGRVPVAGTGGLIEDSSELTYASGRLSPTRISTGNGTAADPAYGFTSEAPNSGSGMYMSGVNDLGFSVNGAGLMFLNAAVGPITYNVHLANGEYRWGTNFTAATADTRLRRYAPDVVGCGAASSIRCLLGGGTAVASAAALPVPTGAFYHVTGTTGVTSQTLTNIGHGTCFTLVFDASVTVTDGGNLKLNGNLSATADTTLGLCCDASNCYETHRSIN
jgi:hypothetical protein